MTQVVSRRPFTAEARVKVALGQVFLRVLRFSPLNISSTVALQTHIIWRMRNMLT
jgi:hypothetical protein